MAATPSPPPPEAVEEDHELDEHERLLAYRTIALLDLGFSLEQTLRMVGVTDVAHEAETLLAQGHPHFFVVEELT